MIQDTRLSSIMRTLLKADSFADALPTIQEEMLHLLEAEIVTVYEKARNGREIISRFKTAHDVKEIRVAIEPSSISGFVALSKQVLCIEDVYNDAYLKGLHPDLSFDKSYDQKTGLRTKSMICLPIKSGDTMLGILQVINKAGGGIFTPKNLSTALELSLIIGQKFKIDFQTTRSPYAFLVRRKRLTEEQLEALQQVATTSDKTITQLMKNQYQLSAADIGESLERYYQVPFVAYDPEIQPPKELLDTVEKAKMMAQCWVPIDGDHNEATILIQNPNDGERVLEIQNTLATKRLALRVGLKEDIFRYLQ